MSWPFVAHQCPECLYFQPLEPPIRADDGYDLLGLCAHPQIGMELFAPTSARRFGDCDLFRRARAEERR